MHTLSSCHLEESMHVNFKGTIFTSIFRLPSFCNGCFMVGFQEGIREDKRAKRT